MSVFRKKNYMSEEISDIGISERDDAIRALEEQKLEIEKEAESLMKAYSRLTGQRKFRKKQFRNKRALDELVKVNYSEK